MAVIQIPDSSGKNGNAVLKKWHKKTGDWVSVGDELFTFEADSGTFTVKSQKAGRLVAIFMPEGETVRCPADVGMLSPATPESVLNLGSTPLTAMLDDEEAEENIPAEEEAASEETPEETSEQPREEESPETIEPESAEEEIEAVGETTAVEETEAEAEKEPEEPEETAAEEETDAAEDDQEPDIEEEFHMEEEEKPPRPASLTADIRADELILVKERTGLSLGTLILFAALHTSAKAYLEELPETLTALKDTETDKLCDLSDTRIVRTNITCDRTLTFAVPAVEEKDHILSLSLCFDQNRIDVRTAAKMLDETSELAENFIRLLALG